MRRVHAQFRGVCLKRFEARAHLDVVWCYISTPGPQQQAVDQEPNGTGIAKINRGAFVKGRGSWDLGLIRESTYDDSRVRLHLLPFFFSIKNAPWCASTMYCRRAPFSSISRPGMNWELLINAGLAHRADGCWTTHDSHERIYLSAYWTVSRKMHKFHLRGR